MNEESKQQNMKLEVDKLKIDLELLEKRYAKIFNDSTIPYFCVSQIGKILNLNQSGANLLQGKPSDILNQLLSHFVANHSKKAFQQFIEQLFLPNAYKEIDIKLTNDTDIVLRSIHEQAPTKVLLTATIKNQLEQESFPKISMLVFQALSEPIVVFDENYKIIAVNSAFCHFCQSSEENLIGQLIQQLKMNSFHFSKKMMQALEKTGHWKGQISNLNPAKEQDYYFLKINRRVEHGKIFYVGMFWDITEQKKIEKLIQHQADYDELTNLPNYRLFNKLLEHQIKISRIEHQKFALISIDLDKFKNVNDTYGHFIGDLILKKLSKRLKQSIRTSDIVARTGGDEYHIILKNLPDDDVIEEFLKGLLSKISKPFKIKKKLISIAISVGIALYPKSATKKNMLLQYSDAAMYITKKNGGNGFTFKF